MSKLETGLCLVLAPIALFAATAYIAGLIDVIEDYRLGRKSPLFVYLIFTIIGAMMMTGAVLIGISK